MVIMLFHLSSSTFTSAAAGRRKKYLSSGEGEGAALLAGCIFSKEFWGDWYLRSYSTKSMQTLNIWVAI